MTLSDKVYRLNDDERAAVRKGMEAAKRGDFVSDAEMAAFYKAFDATSEFRPSS